MESPSAAVRIKNFTTGTHGNLRRDMCHLDSKLNSKGVFLKMIWKNTFFLEYILGSDI